MLIQAYRQMGCVRAALGVCGAEDREHQCQGEDCLQAPASSTGDAGGERVDTPSSCVPAIGVDLRDSIKPVDWTSQAANESKVMPSKAKEGVGPL